MTDKIQQARRELFEAWTKSEHGNISRRQDGEYFDDLTHGAWLGFNAALVHQVSVPDVSAMARTLADRSADACNVNREDNWAIHGQDYIDDVTAMLAAAPSPAGVDGLEVVAWQHFGDRTKLLCALGKERGIPGGYTDEFTQPLCRLSDAQAIIDGLRGDIAELDDLRERQSSLLSQSAVALRGPEPALTRYSHADIPSRVKVVIDERDQQAQRIGELEGLLREVAATLAWIAHGECRAIHDGPIMPSQMALDAAKAALSAGKEGE